MFYLSEHVSYIVWYGSSRGLYSAQICRVVDLQSPTQVLQIDMVCPGIDGS